MSGYDMTELTATVTSEVSPYEGPVYHYTTPAGLENIVRSRELWATEATGMNDLAEVTHGWQFIQKWLAGQDDSDQIIARMRAFANPEFITSRSNPRGSSSEADGIFILSGSTKPDDANQWRLYANEGRGYCIELDASVRLSVVVDGKPSETPYHEPQGPFVAPVSPWTRVLYSDTARDEALFRLKQRISAEQQLLREANERYNGDNWMDNPYRRQDPFAASHPDALARLAQLMKACGFEGENEVRIIANSISLTPQFRTTPDGVVRFQRLSNTPQATDSRQLIYRDDPASAIELPIKSIRIGPSIYAQNNLRTIESLLEENGCKDVPVYESGIALR